MVVCPSAKMCFLKSINFQDKELSLSYNDEIGLVSSSWLLELKHFAVIPFSLQLYHNYQPSDNFGKF